MKSHTIRDALSFVEARERVLDAARPIARVERVPLVLADGRVAAGDVVARIDVPPFDRAAMDGYAVIAADTTAAATQAPVSLACVGQVFTGQTPDRPVARGECIAVATGAPLPAGADAVVMVEETDASGDTIHIRASVRPRQHVGPKGADLAAGDAIVRTGSVVGPARLGALAAAGITAVNVFARPRVAIVSTGNELAEPGQPLRPGQIYDINRFTIGALVGRHGGVATVLPSPLDTVDDLLAAVDEARGHDLMVFSGGSSVGERDLLLDVLERSGEVIFHGIAVKPGKPTALGRIGGVPVLGLPGYPTSCLSNAYLLLVPLLRATARLPEWRPTQIRVPLTRRIVSPVRRHQFYTVRLVAGGAEPAFKASGDITSMAHADGYIEIPADTDTVEAGTTVVVTLF